MNTTRARYGADYRYGRRASWWERLIVRHERWAGEFFSYDDSLPWWRRLLAWLTER